MHPKYITESLKRESCKVLIKGFNKGFLPGSLAEHPIHHLVHSDILHRMLGTHAVLLAEIFLGFCGLIAAKWERDNLKHTSYMSTVITLNAYLQSLPSHHQCRGYIHTCMHVFMILRQMIVERLRWKYSQNNHINGS